MLPQHKIMKILRHYENCPADAQSSAIALGNFDGVHKGHQEILKTTLDIARAEHKPAAVMTFEPHPLQIFKPDIAHFRITPFHDKAEKISTAGIDVLFAIHFDKKFSQVTAESFVDDVLVGELKVRHIIIGHDFIFGHNRKGNADYLRKKASEHNFDLIQLESVSDGGEIYSSSRIREFLRNGEIDKANHFLGSPYQISGKIEKGDQRGRTIGFPTANIYLKEHIRAKFGVYQVQIQIEKDDKWLPAIANLGNKPTFDGKKDVLEVFIFDFDQDIYNKLAQVRFLRFIRPEKKFAGIDDLVAQIKADCSVVKS